MLRKIFIIFLVSSFILEPGLIYSEEAVSLNVLLEEAKKNNPEILAYQKRIKAKEARVKIEGVLDDPTLKVEIEDIPKKEPLNLGDSMLTRYTFSQMFPFPGKLSLKQKTAMKEVLMTASEAKNKELEVITMLKQSYFDYAFLIESIKITDDILQVRYKVNKT